MWGIVNVMVVWFAVEMLVVAGRVTPPISSVTSAALEGNCVPVMVICVPGVPALGETVVTVGIP